MLGRDLPTTAQINFGDLTPYRIWPMALYLRNHACLLRIVEFSSFYFYYLYTYGPHLPYSPNHLTYYLSSHFLPSDLSTYPPTRKPNNLSTHLFSLLTTHLHTNPPTHLSTYPPTHIPTSTYVPYPPATCPPAHLPTCPPAHLPTCPPAHLPTYPPTHLPTCLPTHMPSSTPAHISTWPPAHHTIPQNHLPTCPPTHPPSLPHTRIPTTPVVITLKASSSPWAGSRWTNRGAHIESQVWATKIEKLRCSK